MRQLIPHLWLDNQAEEAAKFYTSTFKNSKVLKTTLYPKAAEEVSGKPAGSVMTVDIEIEGQHFVLLNGGPEFKFSEAISFMIPCKDQTEIDYFWDHLTAGGGEESVCGWLKDKYGLSWQVVPDRLDEMLADKDERKVEAVTAAFMQMKKLDVAALEKAFESAMAPA